MQIKLVKAEEADKPYLLELRKLTMSEHLESSNVFLSDVEHQFRMEHNFVHAHLIIIPAQNNAIAGGTQYIVHKNSIELLQLQIHPEFQNLGLGSTVIKHLISLSEKQNKTMQLKVLKTNRAKHLYERLGFIQTGEDELEYFMQYQNNI